MSAICARSLALALLCLVHDTLAITHSLSYLCSHVPILLFMCGSPTQVALCPTSPAYPLCDSSTCTWVALSLILCTPFGSTPCVEGVGCTNPLESPEVCRRGGAVGGWTGVAHMEGWGAWGWAGVTHAKEGWAVCTIPPLVCMERAGLDVECARKRVRENSWAEGGYKRKGGKGKEGPKGKRQDEGGRERDTREKGERNARRWKRGGVKVVNMDEEGEEARLTRVRLSVKPNKLRV
ncbi:hypothetical protein EDB86DRAFT_2833141 [Lactarius hatsudake]|nr:hypothetical protein EDB86DRAFT_2833141 [Lactarius hatsudake]